MSRYPGWLDLSEAVKRYGKPINTIWLDSIQGKFPGMKLQKNHYIEQKGADAYYHFRPLDPKKLRPGLKDARAELKVKII